MPSLRLVPKNSEEMRFQGCPFGTEIFFLFFLFFSPLESLELETCIGKKCVKNTFAPCSRMTKSVPCGQSADCLFFELLATLAFKMRLRGKCWGMMEVVKSISVLLVEKPQTLGSEKLLALAAARFSSGDTRAVCPCLAEYLSVGCLVSPRTSPENSRCLLKWSACLQTWHLRVEKGGSFIWGPRL